MKRILSVCLCGAALGLAPVASAAIIEMQLYGKGGVGLLPSNEVPLATSGASGGLYYDGTDPDGIFYDDVANTLMFDIAWGSVYGFNDLSSPLDTSIAGGVHLHGPAGFDFTAPVRFALGDTPMRPATVNFSNESTSGRTWGMLTLTEEQEAILLAGDYYFNAHSINFPPGELRANLVVIPEPSWIGLGALALCGLLVWYRRR